MMIYVGVGWEIPTTIIISAAFDQGKTVTVPVCQTGRRLVASRLENLGELVPGFYGLLEPKPEAIRPFDPKALDLVVVPGLAFDCHGNRLGRGGGYYDGFLPNIDTKTSTVALAFPFQVVSRVPTDPHDQPVGLVITPEGPVNC